MVDLGPVLGCQCRFFSGNSFSIFSLASVSVHGLALA